MKLLTNDEVEKRYNDGIKFPYPIKLEKGNQLLYFIGFRHSNDPDNPEFKTLKELFNKFKKEVDLKLSVVLVEGGDRPVNKDESEAIIEGGEANLVTYLADKVDIECFSPEQDELEEIQELIKKFDRERVMYYYFARLVHQWHRSNKSKQLKNYMADYFSSFYKRLTNWADFDFSFENMVKIHDKLHNHPFDPDHTSCFYDDSNPLNSEVASTSSIYRDTYIGEVIAKLWRDGKSIFAVFGSGHAFRLEEALRKLIND